MKRCPFCAEEIQDAAIVCRFCNRSFTDSANAAVETPAAQAPTWNPGVAAVLSFFIPGLGQIYKGQLGLGFVLLVVTIIGYVMLIIPGVIIHICAIANAYSGRSEGEERATIAAGQLQRQAEEAQKSPAEREAEHALKQRNDRQARLIIGGLAVVFVGSIGAAWFYGSKDRMGSSTDQRTHPTATDARWPETLRKIVIDGGYPCPALVGPPFHQGQTAARTNYWSVRCADGSEFAIAIYHSDLQSPNVLQCKYVPAGMTCWQSLR